MLRKLKKCIKWNGANADEIKEAIDAIDVTAFADPKRIEIVTKGKDLYYKFALFENDYLVVFEGGYTTIPRGAVETTPISNPMNTSFSVKNELDDCLEQMKYGRPVIEQRFIKKCVKKWRKLKYLLRE